MWSTYVDPANALYHTDVWNVFNTSDRTTNICEGYHSAMNKAIGVYCPTIYKVVNFLKDTESVQERELAQLAFGATPKKRRAKYVRVDTVLEQLTNATFGRAMPNIATILQYLDAVAFQLWDLKH
jgi:hypothetical protein